MTPEQIGLLVGVFGGGAVGPMVVKGLARWLTGRAGREQSAVEYERKRADKADAKADAADARAETEARHKGIAKEYASRLRQDAFERGYEPESWPSFEQTNPIHMIKKEPRK